MTIRLSEHFTYKEMACRHCGVAAVDPVLLCCLEALRAEVGRPLQIISGYRCPQHNRAVGGAPRSQHVLGRAADIPRGYATEAQAAGVGFLGIGLRGPWAVHVDVRPTRARWTY